MSRLVLYIAMSLDGYIADEKGGIDWLTSFNAGGEDFGFKDFVASVGASIMGARTYQQMLGWGISVPPDSPPTYVMSSRELPQLPGGKAHFVSGDAASVLAQARVACAADKDIWLVGGGSLVAQFAAAGLIDYYRIFVMPLLLGRGLRLFPESDAALALQLESSVEHPRSVLELRYLPADRS